MTKKKITPKEKVEVFEAAFDRINFHRDITGKEDAINMIVTKLNRYSREKALKLLHESDEDYDVRVRAAFDELKVLP